MFFEFTPHNSRDFREKINEETNELMDHALDFAENLQQAIAADIATVASDTMDIDHIKSLTESLDRSRQIAPIIEELRSRILAVAESIGAETVVDGKVFVPGSLRAIKVKVTAGMLNQHLLTLTAARKRGIVSRDESFIVQLPNGEEFPTVLCQPGSRFQERGKIRQFYADNKVSAGDIVVLAETSKGNWKLLTATQFEQLRATEKNHTKSSETKGASNES